MLVSNNQFKITTQTMTIIIVINLELLLMNNQNKETVPPLKIHKLIKP
jgi:hypothetical protein